MRITSTPFLIQKSCLKQRALTLRIPQHVHDAVNAVKERADKAGFVFDLQAVVVEALERAVARVEGELGGVEGGKLPKSTVRKAARTRRPAAPPSLEEA